MSGLDIILNTTFNNPNLPTVKIPGFFDDFERTDGQPITATSREARPWQNFPGTMSSNTQVVIQTGAAVPSGTVGHSLEAADAYASDGVLRAEYNGKLGNLNPWFAVRVVDAKNFIGIGIGNTQTLIARYVGGVQTVLNSPTGLTIPESGEITVTLDGPSIRVHINGVAMGEAADTTYQTKTLHGAQYFAGITARIEEIEFTPKA